MQFTRYLKQDEQIGGGEQLTPLIIAHQVRYWLIADKVSSKDDSRQLLSKHDCLNYKLNTAYSCL